MHTSLPTFAEARARTGADRSPRRAARQSAAKDGLLEMLAARDADMLAHLARIAELAGSTAIILGLGRAEIRLTRLGAEFHDIGKLGIPESILAKSGPLSSEEEWFLQRHSEIGECLVTAAPTLRAIAPIVRAVHERPDGRGYPDGLELGEIPIASRIIAVADAFDAMTHDRPYQRAMPIGQALAELWRHAGTQFDHAVVGAFRGALAYRDAAAA